MRRKVAAVWVSLLIMVSSIVILVEIAERVEAPSTLYVGGAGGGNYSKIQDAINASSDEDTIYVYNGTYYENLMINNSINITGEDKNNTIINGSRNGDVIHVNYDWVNITGFTIEYSGTYGIDITNVGNCTVINNNLFNNMVGISLDHSSNNFIINNNISFNLIRGISLSFAINNSVSTNIFLNNSDGIHLSSTSYNNLSDNYISNNNKGIYIYLSYKNYIINNKILSNDQVGIKVDIATDHNIIVNNNISGSLKGLYFDSCNGNILSWNTISDCEIGFYLVDSRWLIVTNNTMINTGIRIFGLNKELWTSNRIDTSNMVNGKPIYYLKNQTGGIIGSDSGQIILANCSNIIIENQKLSTCSAGIQIGFSNNIKILGNVEISNNYVGISLSWSNKINITGTVFTNNTFGITTYESHGNKITCNFVLNNTYGIYIGNSDKNNITGNNLLGNEYGLYIPHWSYENLIYHNNFINNTLQATDPLSNQWDNGYPAGGNYWSNYTGIDQNSTVAQDIPPSDGLGDTSFIISSNARDNYPLMNPIKKCILLREGWNLISIPFKQNESNIHKVLYTIQDSYDAIQRFNTSNATDHWKHNNTLKLSNLNDFDSIDHTIGFWIRITKSGGVLYQYPGERLNGNQTIQLHPGWNMVGYPSLSTYNRTVGLNNLTFDTHVDAIQWYDAGTNTWHFMGPDDSFVPGRGYWVHSKVEIKWEVPL